MDGQTISEILRNIYQRLMDRYGPQHWWPAIEPFEVIVGAILTQSAAWTNVEKAITNLRTAGKLSPEGLRGLHDTELARLVYSCGYYNVKSRKLKAFACWLGEQYDDDLNRLFSLDIDQLRQQLLGIYGIGEETADSIILYAGNKPIFVIDAYTRRIMSRAGLAPDSNSYSAYQALFMANLPADTRLFNEYHALLVRLAKEVCRARPLCRNCCLNSTGTDHSTGRFPCSPANNTHR
ncbi:MAG: endonuclease [Dehalococcoidales bacterium]|nr:endonuclease [Dehalococcoidales bacterium]